MVSKDEKILAAIVKVCRLQGASLSTISRSIGEDAETYVQRLLELGMLEEPSNPSEKAAFRATFKGLRFVKVLEELGALWKSPLTVP